MDLLQILLITTLIMKQLLLLLVLLLSVGAQIPSPLPPCLQYLSDLQALYDSNRAEFLQAMGPFAVWSGKMLDDMGFPISCLKNPSNAFWEVQVGVTSASGPLTMYYGLCFTGVCNAQTLNQNAAFLINALLHNTTQDYQITAVQFTGVQMDPEITVGSIVVSVLLSLFALSRMSSSFLRWGRLCASESEEEAMAVESEEVQEEKEAGRMPEHSLSFLDRYSLSRAFSTLFEKEESRKVYAFSLFKILAMPFIAFGYLFFLSNYGAANYFSFQQEIYGTFYAKVASFAYFLPDAFFFISAFVFARKLIQRDQIDGSSALSVFGALGRRLLKLYPLYVVMILVYVFVTPSLHSGPLWGVYEQQVGECNTGWWRALLLIDNWWTPGCFSFAWYVQVEAQLCLIAALLFLLYAYRRDAALITLYILLIASFIGLFFGAQLPTSVQTATSHTALLYFQAFYSHLFFYLLGLYFAFVFDKLSVRAFVREKVLAVQPLITGVTVVAFALLLLIVVRPRVWDHSLRMELALSRVGVMVSLLVFFLPSLAQEEAYASRVHRLSRLTYGIILSIGLVTAAGFWGLNFFAYVDSMNLLQSSLSYLLLAVAVGAPLAVIFDFTPFLLPDTA